MKTENFPINWLKSWVAWGMVVLLVAAGIFVWLPHRTQVIEAHASLQTGKKMSVKCTLQSSWGWCAPDSLAKMEVSLDGQNLPIDASACRGVHPVKIGQHPIIVEQAGFPEVILLGRPGSGLKQANWFFLNYSLSQRQVITGQGKAVAYYSSDSVWAQNVTLKEKPKSMMAPASFSKPIPLAQLESPDTYSGMIHIVDVPKTSTSGQLTPNK